MIKCLLPFILVLNLLYCNSLYANERQKEDTIILNEVQVVASFVKKKGYDAVAVSSLSKSDIQNKIGSQEFPEVLKSVPSIYATKQGGGYGDSRVVLRGFGSSNIPVLINGIPTNGMENSAVYWSNWAGLSDATSYIQVQRGIGMSKLGLFSAGGTINIITQTPSLTPKGQVFYKMGDSGYQGVGVSYSTGELPKGWNLLFAGTKTSGNGYVNGTEFEAYSYYVNLTKKFKNSHRLSLIAFGTPQWHNRRSNRHYIEDYQNNKDGIKMNTSYGYINGKVVPTWGGYNEYHKPMISLNHFWTIDEKSYMSNIFYVSNAKGHGRRLYGKQETDSEGVRTNYVNHLQYDFSTGRPYRETDLTPEGLIDYAPMMDKNQYSTEGSYAVFANTVNDHDWYGLLSSYGNQLTDELKFTTGIDMRYYKGYHYSEISDLLGGKYYQDSWNSLGDPDQQLKVGDKLGQDYYSQIIWGGAFAQLEWAKNNFNTFLSVSTNSNSYKRTDLGKAAYENNNTPLSTKWNNFLPYSVKIGSNYRFAEHHNVYANAGFSTRAPAFENVFINNDPIVDPIKEKVATIEVGYGFAISNFALYLTGYYTQWLDRNVVKPIGSWNGPRAYIPNVNALHKGIELDVSYEPTQYILLKGFFTIGDWRWTNDVSFTMVDDNNVEPDKVFNAYIKDLKVGNAPQMSAMLSATFNPLKSLLIGADLNYYGMHYAEFAPDNRINEDDRAQSWKLPNYNTVDINVSYEIKLSNKSNLVVFGNVNNLFNSEYISDAMDGSGHNRETATVWYGFGRTWVAGIKFNF